MTDVADVIVVGAGAAGSAAAYSCARRGMRVLALDRFEPGHRRGSSHGTERIVRFGHADTTYVRFALDAHRGWRQLEIDARVPLLEPCGGVDMGTEKELQELLDVSVHDGVDCTLLDATEAASRWPGISFRGPVLYQPDAGTVHADRALSVLRRLAVAHGAAFRPVTAVARIEPQPDGVTVHLEDGAVHAPVVVVAAGAWSPTLLDGVVALPGHRVTQEQLAFFRPRGDGPWPAFRSIDTVRHYGMATRDGLVKVAEHHTGPLVDPDHRTFQPEPVTWDRLVEWVRATIPGVDPEPVDQSTCLYASTPSEDFALDRVGDVVIAAGLSGHGFKFVPAIGEHLADLVDGTATDRPFALGAAAKTIGGGGHT